MFEQSLYETNEPAPEQGSDGLFHNYELKAWDWSPRFLKLAGVVALVNILFLVGISQTSLLTAKGCDSPFVGRVCQVLDTVYVGSMLFGTEREYVDAAYERTELQDADITFVDVGGSNAPLNYPDGYFAIANPVEYQAMLAQQANPTDPNAGFTFPGIPNSNVFPRPSTGNDLTSTKPNYAKPNKNPVVGKLPTIDGNDALDDNDGTPTQPVNRKPIKGKPPLGDGTAVTTSQCDANGQIPGIPGSKCTPDPNATAKVDEATLDQNGVYINKRPTRDFTNDVIRKLDTNQITLDQSFKVTVKGTLGLANDKKTIVLKNVKPVLGVNETAGDPKMLKLAQEAIIAFADAGWFGYLDKLKSKNVVITLEQNDQFTIAKLTADQPTDAEAATASSLLNATLYGAAVLAADPDTKTFLGSSKTGSDGKTFFVNMQMPRATFKELIERKIAEQKAAPSPTPPPGQPGTTNTGKTNQSRAGE